MPTNESQDTSVSPSAKKRPSVALTAIAYLLACAGPLVTAGLYYQATRSAGVETGFPLDDSWIHAQYSRTLIEGHPFEYVPGEPSIGTTSVLFDVVWAAATWATGEYVYTIHAVNILLTMGVGAVLVALLLRFNLPPLTAGVGAALIVTSYPFPWSNLSGMETSLVSFLTAAAVLAHIAGRKRTGWRPLIAPVLMGLAAMSRPENLILYPISELDRLIVYLVRRDGAGRPGGLRRFVLRAAVFGMTLTPYFALNYAIHGAPVPNTYEAKVGALSLGSDIETGGLSVLSGRIATSLRLAKDTLWFLAWEDNIVLLVLAIPGVVLLFRPRPSSPGGASFYPILAATGCVTAVGFVTLGFFFPGQSQRYMIQWIPLIFIYGVVGMDLIARGAASLFPTARRVVYGAVIVIAVAANLFYMHSLYREQVDHYVLAVSNINDMQVRLGKWVEQNTPPNAVIATNDIGAIAFFGRRPIVDTIGLIDPEVVRRKRLPNATEAMLDYFKQRKVTYAILFPTWHPDLILNEQLVPIDRVILDDNFICGDERMLVLALDWDGSQTTEPQPAWVDEEYRACKKWLKWRKFLP